MKARIHRLPQPSESTRSIVALPATPIWLAEHYIGSVIEREHAQYEAGKPDGESLGLYTSWTAAATALLLAARR